MHAKGFMVQGLGCRISSVGGLKWMVQVLVVMLDRVRRSVRDVWGPGCTIWSVGGIKCRIHRVECAARIGSMHGRERIFFQAQQTDLSHRRRLRGSPNPGQCSRRPNSRADARHDRQRRPSSVRILFVQQKLGICLCSRALVGLGCG
jgi:hypothetical protein